MIPVSGCPEDSWLLGLVDEPGFGGLVFVVAEMSYLVIGKMVANMRSGLTENAVGHQGELADKAVVLIGKE